MGAFGKSPLLKAPELALELFNHHVGRRVGVGAALFSAHDAVRDVELHLDLGGLGGVAVGCVTHHHFGVHYLIGKAV